MKTATGLTAMAVGAVFAFAVHLHLPFLSLQVALRILILVGLARLVVPRSGFGWLRSQPGTGRRPAGRPAAAFRRRDGLPYLMINPAGPAQAMPDEEIAEEFSPE